MKHLFWIQVIVTVCAISLVQVSKGQTLSEAERAYNSAVWIKPSPYPTAVSNSGDILYCGIRRSAFDGEIVHARAVGGNVSPDSTRAFGYHEVNWRRNEYNYEVRDFAEATFIGFVGKTAPSDALFDSESNLYYTENNVLYKNNEAWLSSVPSGSKVSYVGQSDNEIKLVYSTIADKRLLVIDMNTKITISDKPFVLPEHFTPTRFFVGKDRTVAINDTGQMVTFSNITMSALANVKLPSNIVIYSAYRTSKPSAKYDTLLKIVDEKGFAYLVDAESGLPLSYPWLANATGIAMSPDGAIVAVSRRAKTSVDGKSYVEIRGFTTGALLNSFNGSTPAGISSSPGTNILHYGFDTLDSYSGHIIHSRGDLPDGDGKSWTFGPASADGKYLLATKSPDDGQGYWLLDSVTLDPIKKLPTDMSNAITWVMDSKHVVCINSPVVKVWNVETMSIVSSKEFTGGYNLYSHRYVIATGTNEFIRPNDDGKSINAYDLFTWQINRTVDVDQSSGSRVIMSFAPSDNGNYFALRTVDPNWYFYYIDLYDSSLLATYDKVRAYTDYELTDDEYLSSDGRNFSFIYYVNGNEFYRYHYVSRSASEPTSVAQQRIGSVKQQLNGGELLVTWIGELGCCALRMPMTLGGVVSIAGRPASCEGLGAKIKLYDYDGSVISSRQTFLGIKGRFSAGRPLDFGTYDLWVKPTGCLATRLTCYVPMKTDEWVPFDCVPGDVNGDNKIDAADVDALSNAFDTFEGDEGYLPDAELTGDHYVGTDDYLLISQNVGKVGAD